MENHRRAGWISIPTLAQYSNPLVAVLTELDILPLLSISNRRESSTSQDNLCGAWTALLIMTCFLMSTWNLLYCNLYPVSHTWSSPWARGKIGDHWYREKVVLQVFRFQNMKGLKVTISTSNYIWKSTGNQYSSWSRGFMWMPWDALRNPWTIGPTVASKFRAALHKTWCDGWNKS